MDGFIIFIFIFVFIILPMIRKSSKKRNTLAAKYRAKTKVVLDKYGHSNARKKAHESLHARDNAKVFPDSHGRRVRTRDVRDRRIRAEMEKNIHATKNRGVIRAQSKGRSDWGVRSDQGFNRVRSFFTVILLLILAGLVISGLAPDLFSYMQNKITG